MQIDSIYIKNFRLFGEKTFHLNPRFTLIIGENNTGKSTVLEAMRLGMGAFLQGLDGIRNPSVRAHDIRFEWERVGDATVTKKPQLPLVIDCHGQVGDQKVSWRISKNLIGGRTNRSQTHHLVRYAKDMQDQINIRKNQNVILPVLSFQSVARMIQRPNVKWVDPFKIEEWTRFLGYRECLDSETNFKLFLNWLRKMTTIKVQKNKKIGELDAVIFAVEELLKFLLDENADVYVEYDFEEEDVIVEIDGKRSALRMMSTGYITMIGMVADIAYRMALLNPQLREHAVKLTPGVVLIDEIDLHLHPKWQWKIVECLKRIFPNVQFIATTHAPIVISSCPDAEIIDLHEHSEEDIEITQKSPYGWLMEDILTFKMDTHGRSEEVEKEIAALQALQLKQLKGTLGEEELELLKQMVRRLALLLPESDPAVTFARMDAIEEAVRGDGYGEG